MFYATVRSVICCYACGYLRCYANIWSYGHISSFLDVIKKIASEAILFRSFWIGTRTIKLEHAFDSKNDKHTKKTYVFNNWLSGWRGKKTCRQFQGGETADSLKLLQVCPKKKTHPKHGFESILRIYIYIYLSDRAYWKIGIWACLSILHQKEWEMIQSVVCHGTMVDCGMSDRWGPQESTIHLLL